METILQTSLKYKKYLKYPNISLLINIEGLCFVEKGAIKIKDIDKVLKEVKENNKKVYLRIDKLFFENELEENIEKIKKVANKDVDGFYISDFGLLKIFKNLNLEKKVIFSASTYFCNLEAIKELKKDGLKRVVVSNEINKMDISKISNAVPGFLEVLTYGNFVISYSKRKIMSFYFKNFNIRKKTIPHYFLKEEKRNFLLPLIEDNSGLFVYNKNKRENFDLFNNKNITFLISDIFLNKKERKKLILLLKERFENEQN